MSERVTDEVLAHLKDADDCHVKTEIFQSLVAEVISRRAAERDAVPVAVPLPFGYIIIGDQFLQSILDFIGTDGIVNESYSGKRDELCAFIRALRKTLPAAPEK